MSTAHHDVVVVGDGPIGLAHAAAHAAAGRSVALVGPARTHPVGTFELLSGDVAPVLQVMGVLPLVTERAPRCTGTVFRWGGQAFVQQSGDRGRWAGGWLVDRSWFDGLVRETVLEGFDQIEVVAGMATTAERGERWQVQVVRGADAPITVTGSALSLATGRSGRLHRGVGLDPVRRHPMVALTCHLPTGLPGLGPRLLVDAAEDGWWYAMGDERSSTLGYVTDTRLMTAGADRTRATWQRALEALDWAPPGLADVPLQVRRSAVAECAPSDRPNAAVPVGDAALAADPLSGHGLLVGLRGALHAAADPPGYRDWLREQLARHREQEATLYAQLPDAVDRSPFWRRRRQVAPPMSVSTTDERGGSPG